MNICIAIYAHDGIIGHHCGVGTVVQSHIELIPNIIKKYFPTSKVHLFAITPYLDRNCDSFSEVIFVKNRETCLKNNGKLLFVLNGSDGKQRWSKASNWKLSSVSGASIALQLLLYYDQCYFFFHDDPFAYSPIYLHSQVLNKNNFDTIWIPHSTALLNDFPSPNPERLKWESNAVSVMSQYNNHYFGYTSEFMKAHLIRSFLISQKKLIPSKVGVNILKALPKNFSNAKHYTNLTKKYILSYGRCYPTKGFKYLLEAFLHVKDKIVHNLILLVPPDPEDLSYYVSLKKLAAKAPNRVYLFKNFQSELPPYLIHNKNCELVVCLSHNEPCGLIPMETRLFQHDWGPLLIVSNNGGLSEQVSHGINGFIVKYNSISNISDIIIKAVSLSKEKKKELLKNGKKELYDNYNIEKNIKYMFRKLIYHD